MIERKNKRTLRAHHWSNLGRVTCVVLDACCLSFTTTEHDLPVRYTVPPGMPTGYAFVSHHMQPRSVSSRWAVPGPPASLPFIKTIRPVRRQQLPRCRAQTSLKNMVGGIELTTHCNFNSCDVFSKLRGPLFQLLTARCTYDPLPSTSFVLLPETTAFLVQLLDVSHQTLA